jgi:hypothetical protein
MLEVVSATYLSDYQLKMKFNAGMDRVVNLSDELEGEVFSPLKDKRFFQDFSIDCGTVSWRNGADFAPEFLFLISQPVAVETEEEKHIKAKLFALYQDQPELISKIIQHLND